MLPLLDQLAARPSVMPSHASRVEKEMKTLLDNCTSMDSFFVMMRKLPDGYGYTRGTYMMVNTWMRRQWSTNVVSRNGGVIIKNIDSLPEQLRLPLMRYRKQCTDYKASNCCAWKTCDVHRIPLAPLPPPPVVISPTLLISKNENIIEVGFDALLLILFLTLYGLFLYLLTT